VKTSLPRPVTITYRRLPNDIREFQGTLVSITSTRLVIESKLAVSSPRKVDGRIIADDGYLAIWFVYKDKWYDVGKFYNRDRNWIGYYCDIIKPVHELLVNPSRTITLTDLYLDLWISPNGHVTVLDEDELDRGLEQHWISRALAERARIEIATLRRMAGSDRFPPTSVREAKLVRWSD
jgi:predicted RNA-binding protein associated with RNAse of E/G family